MAYRLIVTERADELLDNIVYYLRYHFKNEQAVKHILDEIENVYSRLEDNPFQFTECGDPYLKDKGYREAVISGMNYVIIFRVEEKDIYILGIFYMLENYQEKLYD